MLDYTFLLEWAQFAVRWLHVITAIAWIGSSFYFIALDLGLRPEKDQPAGVHGAAWQVHGGGFYHIQKYLVAPAKMPDELTWFKWESYATWMSGFAMLVLLYWSQAQFYLIDPAVLFGLCVWLSSLHSEPAEEEAALSPMESRFASAAGFEEVTDIVISRCSMCHAQEPAMDGITRAPKSIHLETPDEVARAAHQIYVQAGLTHAMPPANLSFMEPAERAAIRSWYRLATGAADNG